MTYLPLAASTDLEPWGTFAPQTIAAACAEIRSEAGWHIAPSTTETLTLDVYGGDLLPLPTGRITTVTAVRDVTTTSTAITGWTRRGMSLYRAAGWPIGTVEVDLTHGYASTPKDLLPVIVERISSPGRTASKWSQASGPFSRSEEYGSTATVHPTIARYAVPSGLA